MKMLIYVRGQILFQRWYTTNDTLSEPLWYLPRTQTKWLKLDVIEAFFCDMTDMPHM